MVQVSIAWSGADQDPYVDSRFTILNGDMQLLNGGLRSSNTNANHVKALYTETDIDPTLAIRSTIMSAETGIIWSDPIGPALLDDTGAGYWLKMNGNKAALYRITGDSLTNLNTNFTISPNLTDEYGLEVTTAGVLRGMLNDVQQFQLSDTTYPHSTLHVAAISSKQNSNAWGMSHFQGDGLLSAAMAPEWTGTPAPPEATVGVAYSYDMASLLTGDGPITLTLTAGTLPDGLNIVGLTIEGTPTTDTVATGLALTATNAVGTEVSDSFSLPVAVAPVGASWLATPAPPVGAVGDPYFYEMVTLISGDAPLTITLTAGTLPDGLIIDGFAISGVPTTQETPQGIRLTVANATGAEESDAFNMYVGDASDLKPVLVSVNTDDTVRSLVAGQIEGFNFTGATSVTVAGVAVSFTVESDIFISLGAVDLHTSAYRPGNVGYVVVTTPEGTGTREVDLLGEEGTTYIIPTSFDTDPPGLLATTTLLAEIGDGYEGVISADGGNSTITYELDGPHRNFDPAVPNNTITIGWFFDESELTWEQITETTNQDEGVLPDPAVLTSPYIAAVGINDATVGCSSDLALGTMYFMARISSATPSAPDIVNGVGADSHGSAPVVDTGVLGPYLLNGLSSKQKYYYWLVQDSDGSGIFSNLVGGTLTTDDDIVVPPDPNVLTDPFEGVIGSTFGAVGCTSKVDSGTLYLVARIRSDQPSAEEIATGFDAAAATSVPAKEGVNGPYALTGLDPTQKYYYWITQRFV